MFFLKQLFLISLSSIVFFISNNIFATTIIHAGKLIDGKVDVVQSKMTIVINDNLITDVIKGYKNPKDDEIYLDLKDLTVLPGHGYACSLRWRISIKSRETLKS